MKISAAFPSKYLKAADLNDREVKLTISRVELESIGDDDKKPVVYFAKAQRGLVLNKTNAKVISGAYGDDTDEWENKPIILFPTMVQLRDEMVDAIRVKIPKPKAAAPKITSGAALQAAVAQEQQESENPAPFDDEVPF